MTDLVLPASAPIETYIDETVSVLAELLEDTPKDVLAGFARAGIDVDALASQLQDEGAKSFVNSWHELMEVIARKSTALAKAS